MNKKIVKLFFCFFYIFSSFHVSAVLADDIDVFSYPLGKQNTDTFNAACAKIAERPIVKGTFSQEKFLSRFGRSLVSSGNFIIAAEYGMVWETLQPFPSTMSMGNDYILQSRPDGQMSVLSAQGNETFTQMASVLSAVFSGKSAGLLENFNIFFFGSVTNWNIGLLPRDRVIASFAAKITMSGGDVIRSIRIFEQNGDIITYTLSNHNFPTELKNNEKDFFRLP